MRRFMDGLLQGLNQLFCVCRDALVVDCYCIPRVLFESSVKGIEATKSLHNPFLISWESMLGSVPAWERSEKLSLVSKWCFFETGLVLRNRTRIPHLWRRAAFRQVQIACVPETSSMNFNCSKQSPCLLFLLCQFLGLKAALFKGQCGRNGWFWGINFGPFSPFLKKNSKKHTVNTHTNQRIKVGGMISTIQWLKKGLVSKCQANKNLAFATMIA